MGHHVMSKARRRFEPMDGCGLCSEPAVTVVAMERLCQHHLELLNAIAIEAGESPLEATGVAPRRPGKKPAKEALTSPPAQEETMASKDPVNLVCPHCQKTFQRGTGFASHLRWHARQSATSEPSAELAPKVPTVRKAAREASMIEASTQQPPAKDAPPAAALAPAGAFGPNDIYRAAKLVGIPEDATGRLIVALSLYASAA